MGINKTNKQKSPFGPPSGHVHVTNRGVSDLLLLWWVVVVLRCMHDGVVVRVVLRCWPWVAAIAIDR
jgi:hypothetical protein